MPEIQFSTAPEPRNRFERLHPEMLDDGPRAFSVAEVARRLTVSRDVIYQLMNAGRLRSVSLGRRRVIPASALRALLDGANDQTESGQ
jgi:excisionase family DNA binding protein